MRSQNGLWKNIIVIPFLVVIISLSGGVVLSKGNAASAIADSTNNENKWYVGKGAASHSYFTYRIGHSYVNGTSLEKPFNMTVYFERYDNATDHWVSRIIIDEHKNPTTRSFLNFTAYLNAEDLFILRNPPVPPNATKFRDVYSATLDGLASSATRSHPKSLNGTSDADILWVIPNGPNQFSLERGGNQTITTPAGTFDTVILHWRWGNVMNGEVLLVKDFPFPVEGTTLDSPSRQTIYSFELLNMGTSPDGANIPEFDSASSLMIFSALSLATIIVLGTRYQRAAFRRSKGFPNFPI
jgi:hypothetical protein